MCAWSLDDVKQKQWIPAEGEEIPSEFREAMEDPKVIKWAWNAPFERSIISNTLGIDTPLVSWRDTMVLALTCSLPGKLEKAGPVVDLDEDKQKLAKGRRLMSKFSSPRKPTKTKPETRVHWYDAYSDWLEYLEYNDQDETAERAIYHRLKAYMPSDEEWELWHIDQQINEAGIPINMRMVRNAISIYEATLRDKLAEMEEITGLDNANSGPQLLPWLQDNGYPFDDLKKGHITRAIERRREELGLGESDQIGHNGGPALDDDDALLRVLELRSETSRTSPKKYHALRRAVDTRDEVLRYAFQFAGAARTWRWGGRLFQPQNLPRPIKKLEKGIEIHARNVEELNAGCFNIIYDKPMDVLASTIRPAAQAPDGYLFIDADLNAIENRVLGWLAGCEKILRVFKLNRDPYVDFATYLFGLPYDVLMAEYKGGDSSKRTISKPGVLGCLKGETPVLTHRGWKAIVELTVDDWLYDGEGWVRHGGVVWKGYQDVLCRSGIYATLDHRFLVEGEWQEWRQVNLPKTFDRALDTAIGMFSNTQGRAAARASGSSAAADAGSRGSYRAQTSPEDYPRAALDALLLTVAPTSESESAQTCSTYWQIVSTLRERVAKTRKTVRIVTTALGEFVCGSTAHTNGCDTSSMSSERTVPLKLIGGTMTVTTSPEISGSQPGQSKIQIADTWDILNSGANARFAVLTEDGCLVAHNCGYMLGPGEERYNHKTGEKEATGLLGYAWNMQITEFTAEQSKLSVETFRREFEEVKDYWYGIERATKKCIRTGRRVDFGHVYFDRKGPFMRMGLPSGRHLHYCRPRIEDVRMPWGDMKASITYESLNDKKQWVRESTHPGKLTENADQAIARDLLAHGMKLAFRRGLDLRIHVHDQLVGLSREDRAEEELKILIECMEEQPRWAKGLPLGSNGFVSKVFMKD